MLMVFFNTKVKAHWEYATLKGLYIKEAKVLCSGYLHIAIVIGPR